MRIAIPSRGPSLAARLLPLCLLASCVLAPTRVQEADIDQGLALGAYNVVCKGLEMEEDHIRSYATTKFHAVQDPEALECVCAHIYRDGQWDLAVAQGLKASKRDDMVTCLADVLDDPGLDREVELVAALKNTGARIVPDRLYAYARRAKDPKARALAVSALIGTTEQERISFLLDSLANDAAPQVRSAAAQALSGQEGEQIQAALRRALAEDSDGAVRLQTLQMLNRARVEDRDELICSAIMDDPAPEVRITALGMYKGTKREPALACLKKRAFTPEEDGEVREKLLEILQSSMADEAAGILCDLVPYFLEHYAADDIIYKIPGMLVMEAQNERDWRSSLACAQKANAQRARYDCYGKQYIAHWVNELGGKAWPPPCPKTDGDAAVYKQAAGGSGVISFE